MKHKKTITSVAFLLLGLGGLHAQESVNATGGDATGSGGTVAYSVGQVAYTTNTDASGTVSQGVQQVYEIFTVGINETELNISLSVFPNPTANNLTLQISDYNNEKLSYQLYDMQGKLLNNGQLTAQQTQINTSSLPPATYFINVVNQENKKVQSFKIIKN
ncbi:MAG TPA: T9SS type A sorting domain-containing protein [Tenuifilaceae bacterium]|nr:T9SS type A sorting domain-containing protein [Tenuifilaceae bacterium]